LKVRDLSRRTTGERSCSKIFHGSFLLALLLAAASASADPGPNVILVMADDMGWAQTGYYGHPIVKTPNLDDMASSGLRMDRFYAGAPSCTPTRATVLTGRTNDRTGAARVGDSINKQEKMLSTAFRDAGYATAHFGKWHLNTVETPHHPLPGDDPHNPGALGFDYFLSATNQFNLNPELSRNGERVQLQGEGSEVLVREALKFIAEQTARDRPVFVVIWFASPHRPFEALEADAAPFMELTDRVSADHHAEIATMDSAMGMLRKGLRKLKITDNTLLWFTSDNGGLPNIDYPAGCGEAGRASGAPESVSLADGCHMGVHPDSTGHLRGFKKDFYEGGLRVPGIIEWPAHISPRVSNFPSSTLDIFPTLIDVAGLAPDAINTVHDGISLEPVFSAEPARREQPLGFRASGGTMWMDNDWKLVNNGGKEDGKRADELFNIIGDPVEQQNLINLYPEIAARMRKQLDAWNASVDRSMTGADYPEGIVLPTGRESRSK
jgi:arylsulfatase A-like enzyme